MYSYLFRYKLNYIFLLAILFFPRFVKAIDAESNSKIAGFLQQSTLLFLENKGQITDENNNIRKDIDFKLQGNDLTLFVGSGELHYQFQKNVIAPKPVNDIHSLLNPANKNELPDTNVEIYRMDVVLEGADRNAHAITENEQPYYENYYLPGHPNGVQVRSYHKIIYKDIYPKIDWVLYVSGQSVKYDFIVHKGGNVQDIKLRYKGATSLQMKDGGVVAETPFGNVSENKPYSYDLLTREPVESSFVLTGDILTFNVEEYEGDLIIDPVVNWGTYFSNLISTYGVRIVTDFAGNVFLSGYTNNNSNIATVGYHQLLYAGNTDGFLVKFNKNGSKAWGTYYGSPETDIITSMAYDAGGNIIVAGYTSDTSHVFATTGCHQYSNGGNGQNGQTLIDGFVTKFNAAGTRQWGTYYGGYFNDYIQTIACDDSLNVFIGGYAESPTNIATPGSFQSTFGGSVLGSSNEGFFVKLSAGGVRRWGSYYKTRVTAMTCDMSSNLYIGGVASSGAYDVSTAGAHQVAFAGGSTDGYITKFNTLGSKIWGSFYGGEREDEVFSIACDSLNNVYMSGWTTSTTGISTPGAHQPNFKQWTVGLWSYDAMIVKMDSTGKRKWASYYGDNFMDVFSDVKVSTDGYVYCGGSVNPSSTDYTLPPHAIIIKFDSGGVRKWHSLYGGTGTETNTNIAMAHGKLYLGGSTNSSTDIGTINGSQPYYGAGSAFLGYVVQFEADTNLFLNIKHRDTLECIGGTMYLDYHTTNKYAPNNTFTAQLSDASGSFANPVNIGTRTFDSSGTITCTIPLNTAVGTGYRVRVISSSFADTTSNNGVNIRMSQFPRVGPVVVSPVCANGSLQLSDTATNVPPTTTYTWTGPGNFSINLANYTRPNVQITDSGYYVLTANNFGCIDKDSVHATILPKPVKPTFTTNSPVCAGDSLKITMTSSTVGVSGYNLGSYHGTTLKWFASNIAADTVITPAVVADSGTYIAVALLNGCASDPDTTRIVVNNAVTPTVQITANPGTNVAPWQAVTFSVSGSSNQGSSPTYQWTKNGTDIPGATGTSYMGTTGIDLATGDNICVKMTSSFSCAVPATVSSCLTFTIDLAVEELGKPGILNIYPNPANGNFNVITTQKGRISVSNLHGQKISEHNVDAGKTYISLPKGIADGVYIVHFIGTDGVSKMARITVKN